MLLAQSKIAHKGVLIMVLWCVFSDVEQISVSFFTTKKNAFPLKKKNKLQLWNKDKSDFSLYRMIPPFLLCPTCTFCLTRVDEKRINNPFIQIQIKASEPAHQRSFMHDNSNSWLVQETF